MKFSQGSPVSENFDLEKLFQAAVQHHQAGNFSEAEIFYHQILVRHPDHADVLANLGIIAGQAKRTVEGVELLRKAITYAPERVSLHFNLGNIYRQGGMFAEAAASYQAALQLEPGHADSLNNLGMAFMALGRLAEAGETFRAVIRLRPDWHEPLVNLGAVRRDQGDFEGAISYYRQALTLRSDIPEVYLNLGNSLISLNRYDEAIAAYEDALKQAPHFVPALGGIGEALEKKGEWERAYAVVQPLIYKAPHVNVVRAYAALSRHYGSQEEAVSLLEKALDGNLFQGERRSLYFQLGKLYDSLKLFDKAFEYFHLANSMRPWIYDKQAFIDSINALITFFSPARLEHLSRGLNPSDLPVFILGMPRSGTTLVEQILASHPAVYGAGEIKFVGELAVKLQKEEMGGKIAFPACLSYLSPSRLNDAGREYTSRLRALTDKDVVRITDKMPYNYLLLGFVAALFPGVRIIHCVRDPFDTCLSCYFQDFGNIHSYASDLDNLVAYYQGYHRLMRHWRDTLKIPMFEVYYDALVGQPEKVIRRMVQYCGLEWDEKCLSFEKTKRPVHTASYQQVREPIYTSSVQRWKHYEPYIEKLIEGLGDIHQEYENAVGRG